MMERDKVAGLLLLAGVCLAGCATPSVSPNMAKAGDAAGVPPIDPARAHIPFERLEPTIDKPAAAAKPAPLSGRGQRQLTRAERLIEEQRYTEAAIELERALRYDPSHPAVERALSMLHWRAGNGQRALTHARRAIEKSPDDATAHYVIGRVEALAGRDAEAALAFRRALLCGDFGDDPETTALTHFHLAEALVVEGYLRAGLDQFDAFDRTADSVLSKPAPDGLKTLLTGHRLTSGEARASVLQRLGRFGEAARTMAALLAMSPQRTDWAIRRVKLLLDAQEIDDALMAVRDISSNDAEVVSLLMQVHKRAGHPDHAIEDLRARMSAHRDDLPLLFGLVDALTRFGRADEARAELRQRLERIGDHVEVRSRLVDLLAAQRDWPQLLAVCAEGVRRSEEFAGVWESKITALASNEEATRAIVRGDPQADDFAMSYLRGALSLEAGELELATVWLRKSYESNPSLVATRAAMARTHMRAYRWDDALEVARRAREDIPEAGALERVLGDIHAALDDLDTARRHYAAAVQLDRTDAASMFAIAKLYRRSERHLQTRNQLLTLLALRPDHVDAREMLVEGYLSERKIDEVHQQIEQMRQHAGTEAVAARAEALAELVQRGDPKAYRTELREAVERFEPDARAWLALAESCLYGRGERETMALTAQAKEAYQRALELEPDSIEAALGLVDADRKLLAFEAAAVQMRSLLPARPNRLVWRVQLVELYLDAFDFDAAVALAQGEAMREDRSPRVRDTYRGLLLDTLEVADRSDERFELLERWAAEETEPDRWSLMLAGAHVQAGQAAKAVPILAGAYEERGRQGSLMRPLAGALLAAGHTEEAIQLILDRLNEDPEDIAALQSLIGLLLDADRPAEAIELIENELAHTSRRTAFQGFAIEALRIAGQHELCVELIQTTLDEQTALGLRAQINPERLRLTLAQQLVIAGDFDRAVQQLTFGLDQATVAGPMRGKYLRWLAICRQERGMVDEASRLMEQAMRLMPDHVGVNNDVAYGWIDRGVRLDEAEAMIRYAVALEPRETAYLDTLGWLLYKRGDWSGAKKWLIRAAWGGGGPVILDHLGDTCWQLGQTSEAVGQWSAAAELIEKASASDDTPDEARVRATVAAKIDDARAGRPPNVAPQAPAGDANGDAKNDATSAGSQEGSTKQE